MVDLYGDGSACCGRAGKAFSVQVKALIQNCACAGAGFKDGLAGLDVGEFYHAIGQGWGMPAAENAGSPR